MASGHVNRIQRPNTWLHRPTLQKREKSSCQHGAVHTWHLSDMAPQSFDVCCRGMNGPSLRAVQGILRDRCAAAFFHSQEAEAVRFENFGIKGSSHSQSVPRPQD
jgi:hypothetical protein